MFLLVVSSAYTLRSSRSLRFIGAAPKVKRKEREERKAYAEIDWAFGGLMTYSNEDTTFRRMTRTIYSKFATFTRICERLTLCK